MKLIYAIEGSMGPGTGWIAGALFEDKEEAKAELKRLEQAPTIVKYKYRLVRLQLQEARKPSVSRSE